MDINMWQSLIRALAQLFAGWLGSKGLVDDPTKLQGALETVTAVGISGAMLWWSRKHQKTLLNTPPPAATPTINTTTPTP